MPNRIALGSIFIECNHFGGAPADLEAFRRSELFYGPNVLERTGGTVGGMLRVLGERETAIRPLIVASACPSAPVTAACYEHLKSELLSRLKTELPVDGVLLALHGAAAVYETGHLESDLLPAVRAVVGEAIPVVASLDLHAHVTEAMIQAADALVAWETYPHRDAFQTGERAAWALCDILSGTLRPAMAMATVPIVTGAINGQTEGPGPFAEVMRLAKSFEQRRGVYSTSAFHVHPNLDFPEMGGGGLVITDGDDNLARSLAGEIAHLYWKKRFDLEPVVYSPADAVQRGLAVKGGPVLLVETADCCGGGAAGDSVAALKALLSAEVREPSLVPVVDPAAARACHAAGVGSELSLSLGHHVDSQWGTPQTVQGVVRRLSDGRFTYTGGIWDKQAGNMGPAACLQVGSMQICIATHPTYDWCREQYELMGMDPRTAKFVVVKNPMNYRMAYGDFAKAIFVLDTPGPTPPTLRHVEFHRLRRPFFPRDAEIPGMQPRIYAGPRRTFAGG
ncbi:MAG: M81 family metallopeptidase [Planctomycetia bacterium]|nr:M81 family metallopeptidase [Planctomycetia bacterium]